MTIRSLVLFAHVVGVLTLFMALAVDWFSMRVPSRIGPAALPRAYGGASALILLSGIYLARLTGTFELPFVWLSLILLVVMGILGAPAVRRRMPDSWLQAGVLLRGAIGLAAVYLMVVKPALTESLIIIASAIAIGLVTGYMTAISSSRRRAASPITSS